MADATQQAKIRKQPIRVVEEVGKPIALVRARSGSAAVAHALKGRFTSHIATDDELLALGPTLELQVAANTEE